MMPNPKREAVSRDEVIAWINRRLADIHETLDNTVVHSIDPETRQIEKDLLEDVALCEAALDLLQAPIPEDAQAMFWAKRIKLKCGFCLAPGEADDAANFILAQAKLIEEGGSPIGDPYGGTYAEGFAHLLAENAALRKQLAEGERSEPLEAK